MKHLFSYAVKNPLESLGFLVKNLNKKKKAYISDEYDGFETSSYENIDDFVEQKRSEIVENVGAHNGLSGVISRQGQEIYDFIREEEPDVVVETGVCNGFSTAIILKALKENGSGKLYSIDLPDDGQNMNQDEHWEEKGGWIIPPSKEPGWAVDEDLRENWELILGNSNQELPKLLEELGEIDIFLHDSEHSYQTMMLEFCISWKYLTDGGILLSDDIECNRAFDDFAESQNASKKLLNNLGMLRKKGRRK